ncbi:hydrogenase expression/formation protein HypE [Lacrimispora sphenoides]|uniref:Hydrogenase expression/formation protein HypE n=1 Tax=Lacrimispora sphenoides JCM 1415 TaxID=1297793 RepID=A0ABY1C9K3_9FIRM|nr:hydrogenase expression/formation protein HypE [Lacrimispora sphenoides]SET83414.1 hydrogenase expression/formation protein HypE [[Clostridium] sphenoides JCM 1415]SUY51632.1 hydrogenase expression/formation protein HypE [Lacrimispora sphenoides]
MKIDMSYGSGGKQTGNLINEVFLKHFNNKTINKLEDAAVLNIKGKIAYTTDSFVVTPLFFKGGNIGKLAVCGTVNDLSMMGAVPRFLTAGFIIEEGAELETIEQIAASMALAAKEAGVRIVAGDTKVVEGNGGIYINTSGIGEIRKGGISISNCKPKDAIILSGNLGEHHAAILSHRMGIENQIASDCAPLYSIVKNLLDENIQVHCMRDVTRGGLATVLNEAADQSSCKVEIWEEALPVSTQVRGFCDILGLDPLYMANEGKMIAVVPGSQAQKALQAVQNSKYGKNARIIGTVIEGRGVTMKTRLQGSRTIDVLYGEGLPRIC